MVRAASPLFPSKASVQRFDFEHDTLHQPPDGFEARSGQWSVVDSPTATSGTQVLVRGGEGSGLLAVKEAERVTPPSTNGAGQAPSGPPGPWRLVGIPRP